MKFYSKVWIMILALAIAALAAYGNLSTSPIYAAGPWYVAPAPTGNDGNTCLNFGSPCATINSAIAKASPGDTIYVAIGTYTGSSTNIVLLDKDATLSGGWDAGFSTQNGMSTIDGEGSHRGIRINSNVSATIERFVFQNGAGFAEGGGGILSEGNISVNNSVISGNGGGGIRNGFINVTNIMTMNNTVVSSNSGPGGFGGGIHNLSTLIINNSTISENLTFGSGGGIENSGSVTVSNSAIISNTSIYGGGISNNDGTVILDNSTISRNTVSAEGGGYKCFGNNAHLTLNNSTVSGNIANRAGGIQHCGGISSSITLQNTIITDNTAPVSPDCEISPFFISLAGGYNLIGNSSGCNFTAGPGELTDVDAKLGPLTGSSAYYPLLSDSPAIDAGNPSGCMGSNGLLTTDQRGFSRFGRCDIGAYEAQSVKTANKSTVSPSEPVIYTITFQNGNINTNDFRITDTLPISLTYIDNSLSASEGSYGHDKGVISWTGSVNSGSVVTIAFGATVSETTPVGVSITNSAVISGGGEIITRTATIAVDQSSQTYLPIVLKN